MKTIAELMSTIMNIPFVDTTVRTRAGFLSTHFYRRYFFGGVDHMRAFFGRR